MAEKATPRAEDVTAGLQVAPSTPAEAPLATTANTLAVRAIQVGMLTAMTVSTLAVRAIRVGTVAATAAGTLAVLGIRAETIMPSTVTPQARMTPMAAAGGNNSSRWELDPPPERSYRTSSSMRSGRDFLEAGAYSGSLNAASRSESTSYSGSPSSTREAVNLKLHARCSGFS